MKIKDSFWIGLLVGSVLFGIFYVLLSLFSWGSVYHRAPFLLAFIPGIVLFRMLMVRWHYDRIARGILLVTFVGMLLVFFLV